MDTLATQEAPASPVGGDIRTGLPEGRIRAGAVGLALAVALALTACGGGSDGPPSASTGTAPAAASADGGEPVEPPGDTPATTATRPYRTVVIGAFSEQGEIEIGLVELRVKGSLATLTLTYTPRLRGGGDTGRTLADLFGSWDPEVDLVDTVNLKRYVVVRDSKGELLAPPGGRTRVVNSQPTRASYTFAAPPENVRAIDVHVHGQLAFADVEITR